MMRYILLTAGLLALLPGVAHAQGLEQPKVAFPFHLTLRTPDSAAVSSDKILEPGTPTVLAFWLTTCMPCQMEFATYSSKLAGWQKEAKFRLIGISIDFPQRFRRIAELAGQNKWSFPVYWDQDRAFKEILPGELNGLPQVFLFNGKGDLVWRHKGFRPGDEEELWGKIKSLQVR